MSDKVNDLIIRVKDIIQDGNRQSSACVREIENQIDSKENEIRQIFAENIDAVIKHYLRYHETMNYHKRLDAECEQFTKQIEKTQKLSQYDESLIERSEKTIEYMAKVKKNLQEYRDHIRLAKKAALNIKEQKYNNAIKIINQYKVTEPKLDTPLKKVMPLLVKKVQEHQLKFLDSFWNENKQKMYEIGSQCFNKILSSENEKLNIYQTFFGRTTLNNSSIRRTNLQKRGPQVSTIFLSKYSDENAQILNKFVLRIRVQMSTLKKTRTMACQLDGSQNKFNQMLKNHMRGYISVIQNDNQVQNNEDFKKLLSIMIGFLLIKREVCACFDLKVDEKMFIGQVYSTLGKQGRIIIELKKNPKDIVDLKESLNVFYKVLQIVKIGDSSEKFTLIVGQFLKNYYTYNLEMIEKLAGSQMQKDNLSQFVTTDKQQQFQICQILTLKENQQFKFTTFVVFVLNYFRQTYNQIVSMVANTDLDTSKLYDHFSDLFQRILALYGGELLSKDQAFQIIQGEVNIEFIQKAFKYYTQQLQYTNGFNRITEYKYGEKLEQLIVKLTRNIRQIIKLKLSSLMDFYHTSAPTNVIQNHNQFAEWIMEYLKQIISFMKSLNSPQHEEIAIEAMRELCQLYWDYLKELKEFNLITLYNLDVDLSFIYKYCSKNFIGYTNLLDKFRSLREFYSLMLMNNIQDVTDPQKRLLSYPNLDLQLLISMLKKYNQAKTNGDGKIRELKKKDVQAVVKKLVLQYK